MILLDCLSQVDVQFKNNNKKNYTLKALKDLRAGMLTLLKNAQRFLFSMVISVLEK